MKHDESIYDFIKKTYLKYLGRDPDKTGLNIYFSKIKNKTMHPNDLKNIIKQSKEYADKIKEQELCEIISLDTDTFLNEDSYELPHNLENESKTFVSCYHSKNDYGGVYTVTDKKLEPIFEGTGCFGMHFDKNHEILFFIIRNEPQLIAYKIKDNKFFRMEIVFSNYLFAKQAHGIVIFKNKIFTIATDGIKNDSEKAINSDVPWKGVGKIMVSDLDFFEDKIVIKNTKYYNPFSCNHHHHINDITVHENSLYLLSHSYCDENKIYIKKGALSKLEPDTFHANVLLDKFQHPHSLFSYDNRLFLCSSTIAGVLSVLLPNKIKLEYKGIDVYARGLTITQNHIFIGNSFGIGRTNSKFKTSLCGLLKFNRKNGSAIFYDLPSGCDNVYSITNST
mgnify:FL=1